MPVMSTPLRTSLRTPSVPGPHTLESLALAHAFADLPTQFHSRLAPQPLPAPYLVGYSAAAAQLIGLDPGQAQRPEFAEIFAGNRLLPGSQPLAAVYSGHQFGVWAGQLGDGRAHLLGDVPGADPGQPGWELQLKGSGKTPFSRMGDGRAVLRSSIREFLCSEAMAALGIPTSRALCVIGSDHPVRRETWESAAVVTRMAPSFVRFGSFEHWYYQDRLDDLRTLADHVIDGFYPDLRAAANPYQALLAEVTARSARLMAQWQAVGFMHGVMNTDNMSILGLTLDYGPFGFMEAFDPRHICNHTDHQGRYAYHAQPRVGHWNCYALGQALLPLVGSVDATQEALAVYWEEYQATLDRLLHAKLGLGEKRAEDGKLLDGLFEIMAASHVDFTLFFRQLSHLGTPPGDGDEAVRDLFIDRSAFDAWAVQYRSRLRQESSQDAQRQSAMLAVNPKYVLRNYLAQLAIDKAQNKDFSEVARLLQVLERPFDEQPENEDYARLPPDWAGQLEVSCSS